MLPLPDIVFVAALGGGASIFFFYLCDREMLLSRFGNALLLLVMIVWLSTALDSHPRTLGEIFLRGAHVMSIGVFTLVWLVSAFATAKLMRDWAPLADD
jgi:hypothetical protein